MDSNSTSGFVLMDLEHTINLKIQKHVVTMYITQLFGC